MGATVVGIALVASPAPDTESPCFLVQWQERQATDQDTGQREREFASYPAAAACFNAKQATYGAAAILERQQDGTWSEIHFTATLEGGTLVPLTGQRAVDG